MRRFRGRPGTDLENASGSRIGVIGIDVFEQDFFEGQVPDSAAVQIHLRDRGLIAGLSAHHAGAGHALIAGRPSAQ